MGRSTTGSSCKTSTNAFFVADWHALTTDYATPGDIQQNTWDMVLDWLAVGLDPEYATLFIQSDVKEHAELYLLLGMITPLPWLERNPTYKDQQQQLDTKDLSTYGFLGYPVLQAADIIIYKAHGVRGGERPVAARGIDPGNRPAVQLHVRA